jgi:hypothetical protein
MPLYGTGWPLLAPDGTAAAPSYSFGSVTNTGIYYSSGLWRVSVGGSEALRLSTTTITIPVSAAAISLGSDTNIVRDGAANTLALRNSTSAQTFRVYNTTDAGLTNYERGFARFVSNVFEIGTEAGGTGAARAVSFFMGGAMRWQISTGAHFCPDAANTRDIGTTLLTVRNGFFAGYLSIGDGVTAPAATAGLAKIYVDTADGDLKVIFGDGTVKTIVTDT